MKTKTWKDFMPATVKLLAVVLGIIGISSAFWKYNPYAYETFLYYTTQSNMFVILICGIFFVYDILILVKGKQNVTIPPILTLIKYLITAVITVTFIVFSLMLMPEKIMNGNAASLGTVSNIFLHNIVPLLAILDFFLFDEQIKTKKFTFLYCLIIPLLYFVFSNICTACGVSFGTSPSGQIAPFPYFFLDYYTNGWFDMGNGKFGVFYWVIILLAVVGALGWSLLKLQTLIRKRMDRPKAAIQTKTSVNEGNAAIDTAATIAEQQNKDK